MKDNISIIFAAIIGTFLIVILPLYSILDRQDSMSYNVVLTLTTKFADTVRNNGFIDKETYNNYINGLASTGNTYKVDIEAYKKILIHETDDNGKIIADKYVEDIELYNTKDIIGVIEDNTTDKTNISNKNNAYLFNVGDEIYIKVYNTNITAGSVIYNFIGGTSNNKTIDLTYGGVINKMDWTLYNKVQTKNTSVPEAVLGIPRNRVGSSNIKKLVEYEEETGKEKNISYIYQYDLADENNKKIVTAVELVNFDTIYLGKDAKGDSKYVKLSDITEQQFINAKDAIKSLIQLNGMYADIDLVWRGKSDYYMFDIVLTNVRMSSLEYLTNVASITVLPGLGQDISGTLSLGAETVELELTDELSVHKVIISNPHIWKKAIKDKNLTDAQINDGKVYAKEDIAFLISYTGINEDPNVIKEAVKNQLKVYYTYTSYEDFEVFTKADLEGKIAIPTNSILVKFKYSSSNQRTNYIELPSEWIATNLEEVIDSNDVVRYAMGSKSSEYNVLLDNVAPIPPTILLDGTIGEGGWYTSNVIFQLLPSPADQVSKNGAIVIGGCGVYMNTYRISGATTISETEGAGMTLTTDGISTIEAKAYDYVGNNSNFGDSKVQVKIDKTAPTEPKFKITGTKGENDWYTSDVRIQITPGTDITSGVLKTTYKVIGVGALEEREGTSLTLTEEGKNTVIATTYDKAGNKTEVSVNINIDKAEPPDATITVINGDKGENDWYTSNVTLRIAVNAGTSVSGLGDSAYRIDGNSTVPKTYFEGNTKDIEITTNGTHNVTVYTYTKAGNYKTTKYTVKIDKDAPNIPDITVVSGNSGENGWFISDVKVKVIAKGDVGTSGETNLTYVITDDKNISTAEKEIKSGEQITFDKDGIYKLTVYSRDYSGNKSSKEIKIKIDKTKPISAEFVITGENGINGWYTSDITISYRGATDSTSGIKSVRLSHDSITSNTRGTDITLTTKDNAGNSIVKTTTIKLDKIAPTPPTIQLDTPTGEGIAGVNAYNKNVNVNIIAGTDSVEGVNNVLKTTYKVTKNNGLTTVIKETIGMNFVISEEGIMTITAKTYDNAGNVATSEKVIWIDKTKPEAPKIINIAGTNVQSEITKTITGNTSIVPVSINNVVVGNRIIITAINQDTYLKEEYEFVAASISPTNNIVLNNKGTYGITVTQTNMFGTTSSISGGTYYYKYQ